MQGYERPQEQHWALFRACRDRDVTKAKAVISEHLQDTADRLISELRKTESRREENANPEPSGKNSSVAEA
jgi:DNA-binding FadR family transcriptional regulator